MDGGMAQSAALAGLNDGQRQAATAPGPVLAVAGAGTGKTTMIVGRVARLVEEGVPADRILAVTFTNKAGRELRERVEKKLRRRARSGRADPLAPVMDFTAGTFHAISLKLLRERPGLVGLQDGFSVADEDESASFCRQILAQQAESLEMVIPGARPADVAGNMAAIIAKFKEAGMTPAEAVIAVDGDPEASDFRILVARLYAVYQEALAEANKADFGDLLLWTVRSMDQDPAVKADWSGRWDHFVVDEYQDTNAIQHRWLRHLAGDGRTLCAVGDDDQAIYGFAGADVRFILEFEHDFPRATVVRMEENYRCSANILAAANAVIADNRDRRGKTLRAAAGEGDPVQLIMAAGPFREARWIANHLNEHAGTSERTAFALYRANWQSRVLEEALIDAGVDYRIHGDRGFYGREEVLDGMAYLALIIDPGDVEAFERVANKPARGLGSKSRESILAACEPNGENQRDLIAAGLALADQLNRPARDGLADLDEALAQARTYLVSQTATADGQENTAAALQIALEEAGYLDHWRGSEDAKAQEKLKNLDELLKAARGRDARAFLERARKAGERTDADAPVVLMTLHASKGLEADVVVLSGWEEGLFPTSRALEAEAEGLATAIEEERRLAYVGITRARKHLAITTSGNSCRFTESIPDDVMVRVACASAPAEA